jgi:hypothetical protein
MKPANLAGFALGAAWSSLFEKREIMEGDPRGKMRKKSRTPSIRE